MKPNVWTALAWMVACPLALAEETERLPGLTIASGGGMRIEDNAIDIRHWDEKWLMTQQNCEWRRTVTPDKGFPRTEDGRWLLRGQFLTHAGKLFSLEQTVERAGADAVRYKARVTNADGVPTNTLALGITLSEKSMSGRAILIDGKPRKLPFTADLGAVRELVLPAHCGKLTIGGPVKAYVQAFEVRLMFSQQNGSVKDSSVEFTLKNAPYDCRTLDISGPANMGFRDETAEDRKGGWTDQGDNDLRKFEPGPRRFGGLAMDILDPAKHGGKSCLVFSGPQRDYFLSRAAIPAGAQTFDCLYLLHAIAWTPPKAEAVGRIRIEYADGTQGGVDVVFGRDVADWWAPYPLENGDLAWTSENRFTQIGLYLSKFPVEKKPIAQLTLEGTGKAVWMVAGLAGGEDMPFAAEHASTIATNAEWKPLELKMNAAPGSILDFSFLQDAPAGKHGAVTVRNGRFEFEGRPGKRVRFYGANICHGLNFPATKPAAEQLAEQLARMGYNTIRLHHFDGPLADKGSPGATGLDPAMLDRIEYLFHCLKQRGLYLSIDLYTLRSIRKGGLPGVDRDVGQDFKDLVAGLDAGFDNWKAFARNLLTHKNPYTGLTWAEDPALFSICVVNEDYIGNAAGGLFRSAYERWLKERGPLPANDDERRASAARFTHEINLARYRKCREFLRGLGVKALLTDANAGNAAGQALLRDELDYVDNHEYWDHPKFVDGYGQVQTNTSAIRNGAAVPINMAPTRVFGKPFMITEYNFVYPNHFRAESGPLAGAYACLQDWDGLYRFDYADHAGKPQGQSPAGAFSVAGDPVNLLSDRIAALAFLREDYRPAKSAVPFAVTEKIFDSPRAKEWACGPFPPGYAQLGLRVRIGSAVLTGVRKLPAECSAAVSEEALPEANTGGLEIWEPGGAWRRAHSLGGPGAPPDFDPARQRFAAETGELDLDGLAGTFKAVSARSECLVLSGKGTLRGSRVTAENEDGFAVVFVAAMNGAPVAESKRLLVLHLTDTQNSFVKFRNTSHTVMSSGGQLPPLVRRGRTNLRIKLDGESVPQVFAVDMAGVRTGNAPAKWEGGVLSFQADTTRENGPTLAYEIVRE